MSSNVGLRLAIQAKERPEQYAIASPLGSHRKRTFRPYRTLSFAILTSVLPR